MKPSRRTFAIMVGTAAVGGSGVRAQAANAGQQKRIYHRGPKPEQPPLYSSAVSYGGLLFLAGKGAHFPGDITTHTKAVLDDIEAELQNAGSSMAKVLKVNIYLNDIRDYSAMNAVYSGRFGSEPPARTTVSPAGGIPNGSLVEIEVVACL